MTPKEKAQELVDKYWGKGITNDKEIAKQCALIAVNQLIDEHTFKNPIKWNIERINYWKQVKQEIENL